MPKPDAAEAARSLDPLREVIVARFTGGLSPESLALAAADWVIHLAGAAGKRIGLLRRLWQLDRWLPANGMRPHPEVLERTLQQSQPPDGTPHVFER